MGETESTLSLTRRMPSQMTPGTAADATDLVSAIQTAARHAGRFVQILEAGGQSPDHPVHPAIPETRYLKAYFCRVNDGLK